MNKPFPHGTVLHFVRHGATAANLSGLRCGGDLDLPLTDTGRQQARSVGRTLRSAGPAITRIVTSDLLRTRETATLIAAELAGAGGPLELVIEPGFAERHLGDWNLAPTADTEVALRSGLAPPGGEAAEVFHRRIVDALDRIRPLLAQPLLLVGSKGVARVLGELSGLPGRLALDNGVLCRFELSPRFEELADLETS